MPITTSNYPRTIRHRRIRLMRQWTTEERYRVLHSPDEISDLYDKISKSVYRQTYHVQPVTGLSSDPNGFTCHNGTWHLFYQWCP